DAFVARSSALQGVVVRTSGGGIEARNLTLGLNSLKTGISMRDRHMKDKYLETAKHPRACLSDRVMHGKFAGLLKIRGIRKKVAGEYEIVGNEVKAEFVVHISDFNIDSPSYMGVGVENEVTVKGRFPLSSGTAARKK